MELDCTMFENVTFVRVDMSRKQFPIEIAVGGIRSKYLTKEGCFHDITLSPESKCVIFPKGKTTWEGFKRPFKDGDILTTNIGSIFIFSHLESDWNDDRKICKAHVGIQDTMPISFFHTEQLDIFGPYESMCELATEEEKSKLFQAIKDNGYKWNPETKTLEKLGEQKFKNGDIIVCENHWGPFISIFKENVTERNGFIGHCVLDVDDNEFKVKDSASYFNKVRFATKREKELLFQAIEKSGYKWNEETKTLEKLSPNKFDITTLVPFKSRVLMRNSNAREWVATFYSHYSNNKFYGCGMCCDQCIPYEGNEHLLGKTDDCDDCFKTWE